ncbi:hypothetical protein [Thiomicrorhabdus xiamenensis]|uniref:PRTase-CE domain-containing protein n=1 Tax=Thiomicrorhabdus xiamenensis TaxID=2739063 RepID=A0A7D4SIU6_9GAMM|nr:hypothetical protein [Thiomicrorhabdus xiamenensis]QKI90060.1 hypothetical protein HQN79_10970 [Thiomicrorhabdus xiamenensis]
MAFHIPESGYHFFEQTVRKVQILISKKVWGEIDKLAFDTWLRNFNTDEEKYFAAHLLDALIFRSDKMINSSFFEIFYQTIPRILKYKGYVSLLDDYHEKLKIKEPYSIKFVTVEKDSPGASGDLFIRNFKKSLRIHKSHIISLAKAAEIVDQIDVLVFIDDITGTGTQFSACLNKVYGKKGQRLCEIYSEKLIIYCPLVGHTKALAKISKFPSVYVSPVEVLSDEHSFFYSKNGLFRDGINSVSDALEFYKNIFISRGIKLSGPLGFKKQALTCFFSNASVPNNSLPIFYYDEDEAKWKPIFRR